MATRSRISHYDNPYLAVEWHRDPPTGTTCEPIRLLTADDAMAEGWLYRRGGEDTVVVIAHPRANFSRHYAVPGLVERGIAVLCMNTRWLGNDSTLIHEIVLIDVAAAITTARQRFGRVLLLGNSGGASLFTFYQQQATTPPGGRLTETAAGDPFDLNRLDLPAADAVAYLAAHLGEGSYLLHAIDPSVIDESDPCSCDGALDMYNPDNGFVEPPSESRYDASFLAGYRSAQRARVARIDAYARQLVERRQQARRGRSATHDVADRRQSIATEFLVIYRTDADPRFTDLSLDPSQRTVGSLWGVRPDWTNYGAVGFARVLAPEAWLSTWSGLSSRADITLTGSGVTAPSLVVSYSRDHGIFPTDATRLVESLGTNDVLRADFDADHYGFPVERGREPAVAAVAEWARHA